MQQIVTRSENISQRQAKATNTLLIVYYVATVLFLALDYVAGINVRLAFLDAMPVARAAYYGVCFGCLVLMFWRPAWTVLISAFESLVTLSALIVSMGVRVLLVTDRVLETGSGFVTYQEILNFILSGGIAYVAWIRGVNQLTGYKSD